MVLRMLESFSASCGMPSSNHTALVSAVAATGAGAGLGAGFTDADYAAAGARIGSVEDAYAADLVIKVKEPQAGERAGEVVVDRHRRNRRDQAERREQEEAELGRSIQPDTLVIGGGQGGIGLPDESYYREDKYADVREKYVGHIERLSALAGVPDAAAFATADLVLVAVPIRVTEQVIAALPPLRPDAVLVHGDTTTAAACATSSLPVAK